MRRGLGGRDERRSSRSSACRTTSVEVWIRRGRAAWTVCDFFCCCRVPPQAIRIRRPVQRGPGSPRAADRTWRAFEAMRSYKDPVAVFWSNVVKTTHGCWGWRGRLGTNGYGRFRAKALPGVQPHRVSYILAHGGIPDGLHIDHLCRNKKCVNPAHLEAVTLQENCLRGDGFNGRKYASRTECLKGHSLSGENLRVVVINGTERRRCHACAKATGRKTYERMVSEGRR